MELQVRQEAGGVGCYERDRGGSLRAGKSGNAGPNGGFPGQGVSGDAVDIMVQKAGSHDPAFLVFRGLLMACKKFKISISYLHLGSPSSKVRTVARFLHFYRSQVTPNIWYLSTLQRYKFDTLISPKFHLTEFSVLLPFELKNIPRSQKTSQPNL